MSTATIADQVQAMLAGIFTEPEQITATIAAQPPEPVRTLDESTSQDTPAPMPVPPPAQDGYRNKRYYGPRKRGFVRWGSVQLTTITEDNGKLSIKFPKKPSEAIRALLKTQNGFRFDGFKGTWSHTATAFTRQIAESAKRMYEEGNR
jgi:hypothetical protein